MTDFDLDVADTPTVPAPADTTNVGQCPDATLGTAIAGSLISAAVVVASYGVVRSATRLWIRHQIRREKRLEKKLNDKKED